MAGKIEIPETLKAELPPSKWGKVLGATPIVMTVIATLLAGLASSEMTKAQYDRSLAAQLQAKAGDQWGFFQAKKLRGAMQRNTLELLKNTVEIRPLAAAAVESTNFQKMLMHTYVPAPANAWTVTNALAAVSAAKPESEIAEQLERVDDTLLASTLAAARENARQFDLIINDINPSFDELDKKLAGGDRLLARDVSAGRMERNAARYESEAKLNQTIAGLLELQIRKANLTAEKHHARSGKFFIGMLAAQAAVIISTFAIAARKKNFLWSIAAAAGVLAVIFSLYVYLYV